MKTSLYIFLVSVLTMWIFVSCDGSKKDFYTLDIDIEGLSDSTKIEIRPVTHNRNAKPLAEAYLIDGKAHFEGPVKNPTGSYLCIEKGIGRFPVIIEQGKIAISGTIVGTPSSRDSSLTNYDFSALVVTGSANTPRFQYAFFVRDSLFDLISQNRVKYAEIIEKYRNARQSGDMQRIKEVEATAEYKAYSASESEINSSFDRRYHTLIKEGSDSFWGPMLMLSLYVYFIPEYRAMYENFSDQAKASVYGLEVKKELYPVGRPGDKLENFNTIDVFGDSISLEGVASSCKYTLIDFWASWCGPCRREIPNLRKIYDKYKDSGFNILSISIDKDKSAWLKALEEENLPWSNVHDTDGTIAAVYGVKSIPMLVVVDNEGCLVVENMRGKDLENKIDELFAK